MYERVDNMGTAMGTSSPYVELVFFVSLHRTVLFLVKIQRTSYTTHFQPHLSFKSNKRR